MQSTTNIITSENLPPQISFFCEHCVTAHGVKLDAYGAPVDCDNCNGGRLITKCRRILKMTEDYCKPAEVMAGGEIAEGTYYVMLIMGSEGFLQELVDISEFVSTVRSARYMKDRFFFTSKLPEDKVTDVDFFTDITWIPKT